MDALHRSEVGNCARNCLLSLRYLLFIFLLNTLPVTAYGATQGVTGTTTSGSVDVVFVQGLVARITGFEDMPLGNWGGAGSGPLTADDNLCVGRNGVPLFGSAGTYQIQAYGDGIPGDPAAFVLTNSFNSIPYRVFFNDEAGTVGRQELTAGVILPNQSGFGLWYFFNLAFGCSAENANLSIEVPESSLSGAAGLYSGTLSVMLIPD